MRTRPSGARLVRAGPTRLEPTRQTKKFYSYYGLLSHYFLWEPRFSWEWFSTSRANWPYRLTMWRRQEWRQEWRQLHQNMKHPKQQQWWVMQLLQRACSITSMKLHGYCIKNCCHGPRDHHAIANQQCMWPTFCKSDFCIWLWSVSLFRLSQAC